MPIYLAFNNSAVSVTHTNNAYSTVMDCVIDSRSVVSDNCLQARPTASHLHHLTDSRTEKELYVLLWKPIHGKNFRQSRSLYARRKNEAKIY